MPAPKPVPAKCDCPGCGLLATVTTDGTEKDVATRRVTKGDSTFDEPLNRPAVKNINVCDRHSNWPHSEDAQSFAATDEYRKRK